MKTAIIDIGSNSVRLMLRQDGKTLYKTINTTRLGENTTPGGRLLPEAAARTADAVAGFARRAKSEGAERVLAFATEAVRSASDGAEFCKRIKDMCGVPVDVIDGGREASLGALGARGGGDGAVIDVGGASSETVVVRGGETLFSRSLPLGAVRLSDIAGRDADKLSAAIEKCVSDIAYPSAKGLKTCAIGGTATTLAAVFLGLERYDPAAVDGTFIAADKVGEYARRFLSLSVDEVKNIKGMDARRADVIGGGTLMLHRLLTALNADGAVISESDNLEGYALERGL